AVVAGLGRRDGEGCAGGPDAFAPHGAFAHRLRPQLLEAPFARDVRDPGSHFRPPSRKTPTAPTRIAAAVAAAERHAVARRAVGTSGRSGRLYVFGSPRTRKNA